LKIFAKNAEQNQLLCVLLITESIHIRRHNLKSKFPIIAILSAALLTACTSGQSTESQHNSDTVFSDSANLNAPKTDTSTEYIFENEHYYAAVFDKGYALYSKADGKLIRTYTELKTVTSLTQSGTEQLTLAVGKSESGSPVLYSLTKDKGETVYFTAKNSITLCGDFIIADWELYTAGLRHIGATFALPSDISKPSYDEALTLCDDITDMTVRAYLTDVTNTGASLPDSEDTTDYTAFRSLGNGKYVGIFTDNGNVMSRYFSVDINCVTPMGAYVYERTSPAVLMGKVGEFDRYKSSSIEYLVDGDGSFVLFFDGALTLDGGVIWAEPFDKNGLSAIYTTEPTLLCGNIFEYKNVGGGTLIHHSDRVIGTDDRGRKVKDNHVISYLTPLSELIRLTECDEVYAVTEMGALIRKGDKAELISADGSMVTSLDGWHDGLVYKGRHEKLTVDGAVYTFTFADPESTDKNSDPLIYEYTLDTAEKSISRKEYYGLQSGIFYKDTRAYN